MAIRKQLRDLREILQELDQRSSAASEQVSGVVAKFAENVCTQIESMPQRSLVRPAAIALRNLVTSLERGSDYDSVAAEVAGALDCVGDLIEDPNFGYTPEELTRSATDMLGQRGVLRCPVCREGERNVEVVSMGLLPFPADQTRRPAQRAVAMLICQTCGKMNWHDLAALGVM